MTGELQTCTLAACPPGLFWFEDCLGFKTEYQLTIGTPPEPISHWPEAFVVSSGEVFWGGAKSHPERAALTVRQVVANCFEPAGDVEKVARPWANFDGDLPDWDHPLRCVYESGIQYAVNLLAKVLKVEDYEVCDGTEEFDGDLGGTMFNIVLAAMPNDEHGDPMHPSEVRAAIAAMQPRSGEVAIGAGEPVACSTCKGLRYLIAAPSACSAGGEHIPCPSCTGTCFVPAAEVAKLREALENCERLMQQGLHGDIVPTVRQALAAVSLQDAKADQPCAS